MSPSTPGRPSLRMGRKLLRASVWWIIGLISLFSQSLSRTEVQPEELSARPVVVRCHPDSMEVVVQADMFSTGLKVDGRHLRLGSDLVGGGSACGALPSGEDQFTVRAPLMECGTQLSVSDAGAALGCHPLLMFISFLAC